MVQNQVQIGETEGKGRGIFAKKDLKAELVIETAPVIVMTPDDRKLLDQTLLHD